MTNQQQQHFRCEDHAQARLLGGPNRIVEIDESLFFRAKYHRGQGLNRPQQWVFGMVERGTNNVVVIPVPRRDAATLLPLIFQWIRPGSRVISDGWAAYGGLAAVQQQWGLNHQWVNHRINFVDPNDPTLHTQTIEATWSSLKNSLRHLHGTSRQLFTTYLFQYMSKRHFNNENIMNQILFWIRHYMPFD